MDLAALLKPSDVSVKRSSAEHARSLTRIGSWIVLAAVVPIAGWMGVAPLSMAVVAPGIVKVDLNRRPVQHLEGGIVREVLVRDGQHVSAGDPILVLGDVGVDADRNRLRYRVHLEQAGMARLEAEQARAMQLVWPKELEAAAKADARVAQALAKEASLFRAQRDSLESELALMRTQGRHIQQEIFALRAQLQQAETALSLQQQELNANRNLLKDGFISMSRLVQIEAAVVDYAAKLEEHRSELSRAEQHLVENDLKMKSVQNQYAQTASDQLKATAARAGEIEQELRKSEDAAARQVVVAPASGEVIDLKFTSPGAVVHAGEPIAEIVPSDAKLMIEARIRPEDIAHVHDHQRARVKFTAFSNRNTQIVTGEVTYISGDRLTDRATNASYYALTILADAHALRLGGDFRLQAGMPAEVYLEGPTRTALEYLAEPISSVMRRAGRPM
jgi:membrane fusion protein, epimerase transport system